MTTLDVRDLSVEVGGKTVVSDLSFTLRAGDKVGVVGRNGAGKTSLLKVLAGEDLPLRGTVTSAGRDRIPAAGPPPASRRRHVTGLEHILAARELVDRARRLEKARIPLEESHADRTSPGSRGWRRSTESWAATQAESEAAHAHRRARPGAGPARPARCARSRAGNGAVSSSRGSCSAAATCCCWTSPRTTSTPTRSTG